MAKLSPKGANKLPKGGVPGLPSKAAKNVKYLVLGKSDSMKTDALAKSAFDLGKDEKLIVHKMGNKITYEKVVFGKSGSLKKDALAKSAYELGKNEKLIVHKMGGKISYEKVQTDLSVSEIRRAIEHAAPSGTGELTDEEKKTLDAGGFDRTPLPPTVEDPVAAASAEFTKLRDESLSTAKVAELLGVKDSRIRQRLAGDAPTLYGIKVDGDWRVPKFQFDGNARVPGIEDVIPHLRAGLNPVTIVRWFNAVSADLPADADEERFLTPLEWLKSGHDPAVVAELAGDL